MRVKLYPRIMLERSLDPLYHGFPGIHRISQAARPISD
jgi:hypothetical protein